MSAARDNEAMTHAQAPRLAGHALVEALIAQGVDTCFGVPGESYLAVLDGLHQHRERIRFVACRQEGGAAFMAEAQGKLTGRPGVCLVTRGPGATNASIGVHTAFQDSTPMLLLVGDVARDVRDREGFQEVDFRRFFGAIAKAVEVVDSASRLPEYIARAYATALNGRPGPVVLVLPEDMLTDTTAAPVLPRVEPVQAWVNPGALRDLRSLLLGAKAPLIVAGGSGWDGSSREALRRFAEAWAIPVGTAFRFADLFDHHHPLYAGDVGIGPNPALAARVKAADVLIAIGPRLGEMTTSGYTLLESPQPTQQLVHIHASAEEIGRVFRPTLGICAAMSGAAKALEGLTPPPTLPWGAALAEQAHAELLANLVPVRTDAKLDMAAVVKAVQAALPNAIATNGAGNFAAWLHRFWRYGGDPSVHAEGVHPWRTQLAPTSGAMGYGVPAGVAAALLQRGRPVFTMAGDGDFLMNGQELATAMQHGAKGWLIVVADNGVYGTIRMHQAREFPGREAGAGSALANPDFAALARAYGLHASTVLTTAEFAPALAAAVQAIQTRCALIHVVQDAEHISSRTTLSQLEGKARLA
jgi:acetolactate synthase-1/2/3 large subunit